MTSRFQYSVVRYMPSVIRDEAVNVGVLVWAVKGSLFQYKFLPRSSAVRKLWPTADQRLVPSFQQQLKLATSTQQSAFDDPAHPLIARFGHPVDGTFLERARAEFTGNLQLTQPRGYRAPTIEAALQWAYSTYVKEPPSGPRPINSQAMAPMRLRERLWTAFERRSLISPVAVRRQFVINGRHAPWTFDLAYRNGALNLVSSVALNATTPETNLGRALVLKGMLEDIRDTHKPHGIAVVQLPRDQGRGAGVREAQEILIDSDVELIDVDHLNDFVDRVATELA